MNKLPRIFFPPFKMFPQYCTFYRSEQPKELNPESLGHTYVQETSRTKFNAISPSDESLNAIWFNPLEVPNHCAQGGADTSYDILPYENEMVSEFELPLRHPYPSTTKNLIRSMSLDSPWVESENANQRYQVPYEPNDPYSVLYSDTNLNQVMSTPNRDSVLFKELVDEDFGDMIEETVDNRKIHQELELQEEQLFTGKRSPNEDSKNPIIGFTDDNAALNFQKPIRRRRNKKTANAESKSKVNTRKKSVTCRTKEELRAERRLKQDSKNVVKNFGKAMSAFCLTDVAKPSRDNLLNKYQISFEVFKDFVIKYKDQIDSIGSFREMLLPSLADSDQTCSAKSVFRELSELFVRDFAVNWIFSSKSNQRATLLKYRFKILRRVQDPIKFTYLKNIQ